MYSDDEPILPPIQLETLSKAIKDAPVYCTGVFPAPGPPTGLPLFFTYEGAASRIDLTHASDDDLARLAKACQAATFGVNQQDVLDESYRKAGRLDVTDFALNLDVGNMGLLDKINEGLVNSDSKAGIYAELYKLNVYEKGSFFKAHKDTPRGKHMFGSLVLVFPTAHDGGALILRHGNKEHCVDSGKLLAGQDKPMISFVAFYSDVEHEVTVVNSGYRVTLTYNLYFATGKAAQKMKPAFQLNEGNDFKNALAKVLKDPDFLQEGATLIFGLRHQYPTQTSNSDDVIPCPKPEHLKGSDAMLFRAFKDLSLSASVKLLYSVDDDEEVDGPGYLMFDFVPQDIECQSEDLYGDLKDQGGIMAYPLDQENIAFWPMDNPVGFWWVGPKIVPKTVKTAYVAYGNEATLNYVYGDYTLVVEVEPYEKRAKKMM